VAGTGDAAVLLARLAELRSGDTLTQDHPHLTFTPLPEVLRAWGTAAALFR
jgi:hypothetical protein